MTNILFSTTCQWNPGDEFILQGVLNVITSTGLQFNPVLYNRNPIVNPPRRPDKKFIQEAELHENSFYPESQAPIDYVIFAGTPEWAGGPRVDPVLDFVRTRKLRCSFLGVGLSGPITVSPILREVLQHHTDVFVSRDQLTLSSLKAYVDVQLATCPSILSSKTDRVRAAPRRIACGIQGTKTQWQKIPSETQVQLYAAYRSIAKKFQVEYIAHYVDDLAEPPDKTTPVLYSGRSGDYFSIYENYDLVISPRLHACGIAASLGIPSICLVHDGRGTAAELFGAHTLTSPTEIERQVTGTDWAARSERVVALKRDAERFYADRIQPVIKRLQA